MQFYCSGATTFIFDEPLYITLKVSINQLAHLFLGKKKENRALRRADCSPLTAWRLPTGCCCSLTAPPGSGLCRSQKPNSKLICTLCQKKNKKQNNALLYSQSGVICDVKQASTNPTVTVWHVGRDGDVVPVSKCVLEWWKGHFHCATSFFFLPGFENEGRAGANCFKVLPSISLWKAPTGTTLALIKLPACV